MPFPVLDCTEFSDKHRPSYKEMKNLAIEVAPARISTQTAGFSTITKVQPIRRDDDDENEDEDEDEVARIR